MTKREKLIEEFWKELNEICDKNTKEENLKFCLYGIYELIDKHSNNDIMKEYFEANEEIDQAIFDIHLENCECEKSFCSCPNLDKIK